MAIGIWQSYDPTEQHFDGFFMVNTDVSVASFYHRQSGALSRTYQASSTTDTSDQMDDPEAPPCKASADLHSLRCIDCFYRNKS